MTNASCPLLGSVALALVLGGCAAQAAPDEAPPDVALGQSAAALVAFNPCASDWQLPTSARRALDTTDSTFLEFEDALEAGGARWIGNFELPKPYRAVVRVDTYLTGTKKNPRSGLWYLAAIPVGSAGALAAVNAFKDREPVHSRTLGYCLAGGTFILNNGTGPGNLPVKQIIVEYDPRCVCVSATVTVQRWVNWATYEETPTP
jgi:hypothetical protein